MSKVGTTYEITQDFLDWRETQTDRYWGEITLGQRCTLVSVENEVYRFHTLRGFSFTGTKDILKLLNPIKPSAFESVGCYDPEKRTVAGIVESLSLLITKTHAKTVNSILINMGFNYDSDYEDDQVRLENWVYEDWDGGNSIFVKLEDIQEFLAPLIPFFEPFPSIAKNVLGFIVSVQYDDYDKSVLCRFEI